jgi:hypothetical protein
MVTLCPKLIFYKDIGAGIILSMINIASGSLGLSAGFIIDICEVN